MKSFWIALTLGLAAAGNAAADDLPLAMEFSAEISRGLLVGSQPAKEDIRTLKDAGYSVVLNLRKADELATKAARGEAKVEPFDEAAYARLLGLVYVNLPIVTPSDLTEDNIRAADTVLAAANGPALVHCSSGNRAGAILALRAYWVEGRSAEDSLAIGKKAGLTRWEAVVREKLGLSALN